MNMMISYQELVRTFPNLPTQQETLGEIVTEILKDGRNLSRKSLCAKLLCRLEQATGEEEQKHYNALIGLLFE
ncbi:regulatory protein YcgZ [Escherichia coli]|uniref:regulatory protein YcgZ n=1 Tax=Escherichia coli TaxID=562 RepID=UPI001E3BCA38|nr:regulatory protein YcgZ [Escherichia coli]MCE3656315.1 two-component-system connector protein YcgZ [Escherichia coli]